MHPDDKIVSYKSSALKSSLQLWWWQLSCRLSMLLTFECHLRKTVKVMLKDKTTWHGELPAFKWLFFCHFTAETPGCQIYPAPRHSCDRQRASVSRGSKHGYLDELAARTAGATPHTSCCPGNKRHSGRPLSSPLWTRRHKALMAAYAPLPGGRQTATVTAACERARREKPEPGSTAEGPSVRCVMT